MTHDDKLILIYASLVGWRHHPGYKARGLEPPSLEDLWLEALYALQQTEEPTWPHGSQAE